MGDIESLNDIYIVYAARANIYECESALNKSSDEVMNLGPLHSWSSGLSDDISLDGNA